IVRRILCFDESLYEGAALGSRTNLLYFCGGMDVVMVAISSFMPRKVTEVLGLSIFVSFKIAKNAAGCTVAKSENFVEEYVVSGAVFAEVIYPFDRSVMVSYRVANSNLSILSFMLLFTGMINGRSP
ncbi:3205_t:CDS:2, partial [Dentiscutata erythropus]